MKKLVDTIKAIPTLFNGVKYKSRLEARFAEYLLEWGVKAEYEKPLPYSHQKYVPDFFIEDYGIYIEIKPRELLRENGIFSGDINNSNYPWVCIDKVVRNSWGIIDYNSSFLRCRIDIPCKIDFASGLRLYPKYWEVPKVVRSQDIIENRLQEEEDNVSQMPASPGTAREHFAKMRAMLAGR